MGLDITAYPADYNNRFLVSHSIIKWTEDNFPGRSEGLEGGAVYAFEESFGFRAGSYGGYNDWRDWLARMSGWESAKTTGPFYELIHFADNEGVIGPKVAAKLAKDFAEHADKAKQMAQDDFDLQRYQNWQRAFEMAADNGAVDFH